MHQELDFGAAYWRAYREAGPLNREGAGWFSNVSSWSSNFLPLELYLLDAEVKENTEEGRGNSSLRPCAVKCFTAKGRKGPKGGGRTGYRSLSWSGGHKHFIHLNLDFSAKLMMRLIRIGC